MRLTAAITPEDGGFVAQCLEVDVASQGETVETALANLREALELYFEDAPGPVRASLFHRADRHLGPRDDIACRRCRASRAQTSSARSVTSAS